MSLLIISEKIYHPLYQDLPFEIKGLDSHCPDLFCQIKDYSSEIVLIDSGFDPETGLRALKDIKRIRPDLPVVFITDTSSEDIAIRAFRTGAEE